MYLILRVGRQSSVVSRREGGRVGANFNLQNLPPT